MLLICGFRNGAKFNLGGYAIRADTLESPRLH